MGFFVAAWAGSKVIFDVDFRNNMGACRVRAIKLILSSVFHNTLIKFAELFTVQNLVRDFTRYGLAAAARWV